MLEIIGKKIKIIVNYWIFKYFRIFFVEFFLEIVGEEVEKEVCVVGLMGICEKKLLIKIKKCVGYNVYFLIFLINCYKVYCFCKLK